LDDPHDGPAIEMMERWTRDSNRKVEFDLLSLNRECDLPN
jgi:hypothetical protein